MPEGAERYWEARWRDEVRENMRLMAALEHIVRECGALNKGPAAVKIAMDALGEAAGAVAAQAERRSMGD